MRSLAQLAVLGGALSYAFAGAWARATMGGLRPQVAAAGMLTASALVMVPAAIWLEGWPSADLAPGTVSAVAYYAVIATALAYLLYYRVLAMAGSGNLLICTLLIAPVAILLGTVCCWKRRCARRPMPGSACWRWGCWCWTGGCSGSGRFPIERLRRTLMFFSERGVPPRKLPEVLLAR